MPLTPDTKNPYEPDTPKWQLFENAIGALRLEQAFAADAERFQAKAKAAREKVAAYEAALEKLKD